MSLNHTSRFADLTSLQYERIGRIVIEWANVEFLLKQMLARLLLTPDFLGRSYTDRMNASRIQEAIEEAIKIHYCRYGRTVLPHKLLDEITTANTAAKKARLHRNKFAHFCWCRSTDDEIFGTDFHGGVPSIKNPNKGTARISNATLQELHTEVYALVERLETILRQLREIPEEEAMRAAKAASAVRAHRGRR